MLPTQTNSALHTDILPTQNIVLFDQNQSRILSLLPNSSSPSSTKPPRQKRTAKVDRTIPVMINPQITRTPKGFNFDMPYHHSTILPDSMPSFVPVHPINGRTPPWNFFLGYHSYDANNNINHNQNPLNSSLPTQDQQTSLCSNDFSPLANANSMTQMVAKSHPYGVNHLLNNPIRQRPMSSSPTQQNELKLRNSSFVLVDHGSLLDLPHSLSSSLTSIPTSTTPPTNPRRRYSKRRQTSAPVEQQPSVPQISHCPTTFTPPTVMNTLPSTIPTSLTATSIKPGEHSYPMDVSASSNFVPLSPPASTSSMRSPPINMNNESSLLSMQQHLLPQTSNNITEVNSTSRQYFPDQRFCHTQNIINDPSRNHFHNLFAAAACSQYYMAPNNYLPMTYTSMLPGTIATTVSEPMPSDIKKGRKKREKAIRKPKVEQSPTSKVQIDAQSLIPKSLTTDIPGTKKRKPKNSKLKDIRTKKQLRRITRQNQLAVLKFMIRKRKQQKQERTPVPKLTDIKTEQVVPKLVSIPMTNPNDTETTLPDIITPGLKISFDATQKIESISLYYHRRHKPDRIGEGSPKSSINADNKLGLLLEALELMETLHGSSKLALPSIE